MLLVIDDKLQTDLVFRKETFKSSKREKVLDVTIDNKLKFARYLANITTQHTFIHTYIHT